jgi:uncharacterized membrane protein (UPF0136 family)
VDKRLAWMVVGFGLLVIAGGVIGYTKGSTASLITAGPMGLLVTGFGLLALRGAPWARRAACYACAAVAAVMLSRLIQTGKVIPSAPVAALGLALAAALFRSDRKAT